MSVADELERLAGLHQQGHISSDEYREAKQQVLRTGQLAPEATATQPDATQPDGSYLLYQLVATWLTRAAAGMAVVGVLFGLVAGWSAVHYFDLNGQAAALRDASLARGFGVRIPDPRPTIERSILETKATAYGVLAAVTGLITCGALIGALLVRPPRPRRGAAPPRR